MFDAHLDEDLARAQEEDSFHLSAIHHALRKARSGEQLYCFVDETGQDTKGALFCVVCTVVLSANAKDELERTVEEIERVSRKRSKWQKTDKSVRKTFLDALVTKHRFFTGTIYFQHFYQVEDYDAATVEAIARSIQKKGYQDAEALVYIDGLGKHRVSLVGTALRRHGIKVEKVKGLKDEQSALIRLSDAIAGFVRDYLEGQDYAKSYFLIYYVQALSRKYKKLLSLAGTRLTGGIRSLE